MGSAGRIVIPKKLRDAAGLDDGAPVEIALQNGILTIERAEAPMHLERRGYFLVVVHDEDDGSVLTNDDVERVRSEIHDERFRAMTGGLEPSGW